MPFKSKAQRRKFAQLLVEGEITPEVFEEWNRETGGSVLPERVTPKKRKAKSASRRKRPARRATSATAKRKTVRKRATARKRKTARKR